ncbi:DUF2147 domain-containing protein [Ideonella sp. A 288]|uniref:DUF2147 domain-containing protein n=1 Tax=Ideonella sp. A 288 TaxID=1962181 RepID=UPI000B4BA140|nr:DUF2147 domain-containing protein [Ideonella sp. A 288]
MKTMIAAIALIGAATLAQAQATPVGVWKTIDDDGKTEKSLVRITEAGGALTGTVEKIFDPAKQNEVCEKCNDERKGKPVLGMTIIRDAKPGEDKSAWEGGNILDPNNGKVYKLRLKPIDGGKKLEVRGYIGPFFRNQQWVRAE